MDSKTPLNTFEQDGGYCGNFNIWEICFRDNQKIFARFEKQMRPRGYFLARIFGSRRSMV